jgi:hypothetical protein
VQKCAPLKIFSTELSAVEIKPASKARPVATSLLPSPTVEQLFIFAGHLKSAIKDRKSEIAPSP